MDNSDQSVHTNMSALPFHTTLPNAPYQGSVEEADPDEFTQEKLNKANGIQELLRHLFDFEKTQKFMELSFSSKQRHYQLFPESNEYKIQLPNVLRNVNSIRVVDADIQQTEYYIDDRNNVLQWVEYDSRKQRTSRTYTAFIPHGDYSSIESLLEMCTLVMNGSVDYIIESEEGLYGSTNYNGGNGTSFSFELSNETEQKIHIIYNSNTSGTPEFTSDGFSMLFGSGTLSNRSVCQVLGYQRKDTPITLSPKIITGIIDKDPVTLKNYVLSLQFEPNDINKTITEDTQVVNTQITSLTSTSVPVMKMLPLQGKFFSFFNNTPFLSYTDLTMHFYNNKVIPPVSVNSFKSMILMDSRKIEHQGTIITSSSIAFSFSESYSWLKPNMYVSFYAHDRSNIVYKGYISQINNNDFVDSLFYVTLFESVHQHQLSSNENNENNETTLYSIHVTTGAYLWSPFSAVDTFGNYDNYSQPILVLKSNKCKFLFEITSETHQSFNHFSETTLLPLFQSHNFHDPHVPFLDFQTEPYSFNTSHNPLYQKTIHLHTSFLQKRISQFSFNDTLLFIQLADPVSSESALLVYSQFGIIQSLTDSQKQAHVILHSVYPEMTGIIEYQSSDFSFDEPENFNFIFFYPDSQTYTSTFLNTKTSTELITHIYINESLHTIINPKHILIRYQHNEDAHHIPCKRSVVTPESQMNILTLFNPRTTLTHISPLPYTGTKLVQGVQSNTSTQLPVFFLENNVTQSYLYGDFSSIYTSTQRNSLVKIQLTHSNGELYNIWTTMEVIQVDFMRADVENSFDLDGFVSNQNKIQNINLYTLRQHISDYRYCLSKSQTVYINEKELETRIQGHIGVISFGHGINEANQIIQFPVIDRLASLHVQLLRKTNEGHTFYPTEGQDHNLTIRIGYIEKVENKLDPYILR